MLEGLGHGHCTYSNMGNIFAHALRSMAATAVYCDYPKALVDCAHFLDAQSRLHACFDGVEAESGSYQAQVVGHMSRSLAALDIALPVLLESGQLQAGSFEHETIRMAMAKAKRVRKGNLRYPNGDAVRIGDTWGTHSTENTAFASSRAVPDSAWGFFPLCSTNRTFVGLNLPPQFYSHHHRDDLSIVLWGSGRELLPEYGYNKAFYRYFSTDIHAHNASAVAWRDGVVLEPSAAAMKKACEAFEKTLTKRSYPSALAIREPQLDLPSLIRARQARFADYHRDEPIRRFRLWRRAVVHQYVPEGLVSLVDAASPGPVERGVHARSRLVILLPVHRSAAYLVDIHRIAGGDMHQIGVQAPFGETVRSACSGAVADADRAARSLEDWCSRLGPYFRGSFRCLEVRDGANPWTLDWQTGTSGVWLKVRGLGDDGALLLAGETPDTTRDPYRQQWGRPKDAVPIPYRPHFYIRRESPAGAPPGSMCSVTALVYEHGRTSETETDRIAGLERVAFAGDSRGASDHRIPVALKISFTSGRIDYVYSSSDDAPRVVDGFTFRGRGGLVVIGQGRGPA